MRDERGSTTLWLLGLSLALLMLGSIAFDLWRGLAERRELAAVADAAAVAAASGIDETLWRTGGELRIEPNRARVLAEWSVSVQEVELEGPPQVVVSPDGGSVTVEVRGFLPYSLLRLLALEGEGLEVRAVATAEPRLVP